LQKLFFGLQCELAQELNLPVVVHSRDDFDSTFDVLRSFKNLKIYFHCW
jgi:TatD DNase family protein